MKAKDLLERSTAELSELAVATRKELFELKFKNFTNRLDNTGLIQKSRKNVARLETILRQTVLIADGARGSEQKAGDGK
jgi:large subunit ribosomal protein L29